MGGCRGRGRCPSSVLPAKARGGSNAQTDIQFADGFGRAACLRGGLCVRQRNAENRCERAQDRAADGRRHRRLLAKREALGSRCESEGRHQGRRQAAEGRSRRVRRQEQSRRGGQEHPAAGDRRQGRLHRRALYDRHQPGDGAADLALRIPAARRHRQRQRARGIRQALAELVLAARQGVGSVHRHRRDTEDVARQGPDRQQGRACPRSRGVWPGDDSIRQARVQGGGIRRSYTRRHIRSGHRIWRR